MRRHDLIGTVACIAMLCCCGGVPALASEADELRERAQVLKREAAAHAERGEPDRAERKAKEAARLLEAAERMQAKAGPSPPPVTAAERPSQCGLLHSPCPLFPLSPRLPVSPSPDLRVSPSPPRRPGKRARAARRLW